MDAGLASTVGNITMVSFIDFFLTANILPSVFSGVSSRSQNCLASENTEASAERTFFYVGGQYVNSTFVSTLVTQKSG